MSDFTEMSSILNPYQAKPVSKIVIMKCHNHKLQTKARHREEEPQTTNSHKTLGRQLKQDQLPLPRQCDCKTRKDTLK